MSARAAASTASDSPQPSGAQDHAQRSHRGKKERMCPLCSQLFSKTEHLARHVRSHTKEKPFECEICGKVYARHDTLLRHSRGHPQLNVKPSRASRTGRERMAHNRSPTYDQTNVRGESEDQEVSRLTSSNRSAEAASALLGLQNVSNSQFLDSRFAGFIDPSLSAPTSSYTVTSQAADATSTSVPSMSFNAGQPESPQPDPNSEMLRSMMMPTNSISGTISDNMHHLSEHNGNIMQTPTSLDFWDLGFDSQGPSWMLGDDFDLNALNSSIAATITQFTPSLQFPTQPTAEGDNGGNIRPAHSQANAASRGPKSNMSQRWFTHIDKEKTGHNTPGTVTPRSGQNQTDVDENYRISLTKKLRPRLQEESLPSTDFLNLCVRMYFTRFNPTFPVVHAPTFRPSADNSLLLLSICSVGSLFIGSAGAAAQGTKIFERLNKAVLASWEHHIARDAAESVSMVQAALIGQTFGLLSGNPKHLATVESFHGTVISWARRGKMFGTRQSSPQIEGLTGHELDKAWRAWGRSEEIIRIVLGLHIHDAELTAIFHHEPLLRHDAQRLPSSGSNEIFLASTAREWAVLMKRQLRSGLTSQPFMRNEQRTASNYALSPSQGIQDTSRFTAYTILEGIGAAVSESRQRAQFDTSTLETFSDALIEWYEKYQKSQGRNDPDPFCLMVLWHSIFMSLFVDFDLLERTIGREGSEVTELDLDRVSDWASSFEATRCVIHASLVHKQLETMRVGTEPAIHVPRVMFLAAIAWYCYTRFGSDVGLSASSKDALDFVEIKLLDVNAFLHLFEANGFKCGKPTAVEASPLCGLTDLLQRMGHWEIARKFASILGSLIHGETDEGLVVE